MVGKLSFLFGLCGNLLGAFAVKLQAYIAYSYGIHRHKRAIRVGFTGLNASYLVIREGRYSIGPYHTDGSCHSAW